MLGTNCLQDLPLKDLDNKNTPLRHCSFQDTFWKRRFHRIPLTLKPPFEVPLGCRSLLCLASGRNLKYFACKNLSMLPLSETKIGEQKNSQRDII